ncbi:Na+/H+ antiporter subunit E [Planococcus lenghuensis]|uniref:Na+/H+ antiporter subunit E n=1 Tax=Planococcus lenghuensis TaxID=2213202 RepID=A0A1Q2KY49_9BACL|nr:Na+/H+ antiporter subunit E [Planococcus lenghuensis]AQQ52717.1 Na+/H+ antiporter subunit E [Planococcus lenghuensis]
MAFQILLNFFLALVWMFMSVSFTSATFIIGYLLGLFLLILMRRFFNERLYLFRIWAVISLFFLFMKELFLSSVQVFLLILKPRMNIRPAIFEYDTVLKYDWEITLLSLLITLTPGTLVLAVSDDQKKLYIHAIDADDIDDAVKSIQDTFEKAILEVSRT